MPNGRSSPLVSVVMPVYNNRPFLQAALDSVLHQTLSDIELVVVDDGSTDGSSDIIDACAATDHRVVVVRQPNAGMSRARNAGIRASQAPFVAMLDGDDIAMPRRLEQQHAFLLQHPEVAALGGCEELIDDRGRVLARQDFPLSDAEIRASFASGNNALSHSTVIVRREVFERVGYYRPALHTEDFDLWLRIAEHFQWANLPDIVCQYRVHPTQAGVAELEQQALGLLAVLAAARARAEGRDDGFDDVDRLTPEHLRALGVTDADVTTEVVRRGCSVAQRMDLAGHSDLARLVSQRAEDKARTGPKTLMALVHRERAGRHARHGQRVRANVELIRAALANRSVESPLAVARRRMWSGANRSQRAGGR